MKLRGILSIGVVLAVTIHATYSFNCSSLDGQLNATVSITDFSTNLLKAVLNDSRVEKNFISSPLSVAMVLLMAGFGARGSTAAEFHQFLHSELFNECSVRALTTKLNSYKNVELTLANKIFANNQIDIKEEYQNTLDFALNSSGIQKLDFTQSTDAARKINEWSEAQTKSKIKNLVSSDDVTVDTKLVLVNAIYFKAKWAREFSKVDYRDWFYSADGGKKKVDFMNTNGRYRYGILSEISSRFVEIPYKSEKPEDHVSMFVIKPREDDGLPELEKNIHKISLKTLQSGNMTNVDITLPLFKIESKIELGEILQSMGMKKIFSDQADFSGISETSGLKISDIVQKAYIEVNEKGSEAAAVTRARVVTLSASSEDDYQYFIANHPFLVLIATKDDILFSGRVTDIPESPRHKLYHPLGYEYYDD